MIKEYLHFDDQSKQDGFFYLLWNRQHVRFVFLELKKYSRKFRRIQKGCGNTHPSICVSSVSVGFLFSQTSACVSIQDLMCDS